ncbi:MAG: protein phosphatase 2C domain-containing protein [Bdellovibrionota bacterium]
MRIRMAGATDVGRRRKANQDSLFYDAAQGIGIVADGIGGRSGGEVASSMVVNGLRKAFLEVDRIRHEEIHPFLTTNVDRINQQLLDRGAQDPMLSGMGTTLNCVMFVGNKLVLAHIGDSRTYLYSQGHLFQLTLDHNVKTFLERGWLGSDSVIPGSGESALVRALGLFEHCEVDIYEKTVKGGEIYLTSSDGLFDMVRDADIARIISNNLDDFNNLPTKLIAEANRNGGRDNITVLLSKMDGD